MNNKTCAYLLALLVVTNIVVIGILRHKDIVAFLIPNTENAAQVPYFGAFIPISGNSEQFTLFDGKSTLLPDPTCGEYLTQVAGIGRNGGNGLRLAPDTWHTPSVKILCPNRSRHDLGDFTNLTFWIRSDSTTPDPVSVSFWTYAGPSGYATSPIIPIAPYISGGSLNATWKQVVIPVSLFKSPAWNLANADAMNFSASPSNSVYIVDSIVFQSSEVVPIRIQNVTVTLSAVPLSIIEGNSSSVSWSSANASSCTASSDWPLAGWSGTLPLSGAVQLYPTRNTVLTISCRESTGSESHTSVTIQVSPALQTPTLSITASPQQISPGGSSHLSWTSTNTTGCTASQGWSGSKPTSGTLDVTPAITTTYTLTCSGSGGTTNPESVTVVVNTVGGGPIDLSKQFKLWSGDTTADRAVTITHGSLVSDSSVGHSVFRASPDQWNAGSISLASLPDVYRKSISSRDYIQMTIKIVPNAGTNMPTNPHGLFYIYGWPNTSAGVPIENYIVGGGSLDGSYRTVRIPTSALRVSGGFDLTSIEYLWFGLPSGVTPTYSFQVYDIYALKTTPNDVVSLQTLSNTSIRLTTKDRYPLSSVLSPANYTLSSTDDPAYASQKTPVSIGRQVYVNGFEGSVGGSFGLGNAPTFAPYIYLSFNPPMQDGRSYVLRVQNIPDMSGNNFAAVKSMPFLYDDRAVTGSVQTNQVGFLPVSPKYAYVGNYLGDAGSLTGTPSSCFVTNTATGASTIYPATLRGTSVLLIGNTVYGCDFSAVTTPGTYYVYVPGFGRTYNFSIATNVYAGVFRTLSDFYYNQRADMPIVNGQWSRPAGTLPSDQTARLHPVDYVSSANNPLPLSTVDYPTGTTLDMVGGWYDAGDYGKYILPASGPINDLLFAYELYPGKFTDNQADIPEKGNGVPDILDEVKYEIDWYQKMQAKDGGVFDRLTAQNWELSPYDIQPRYLDPESTHSTALYAAVLAQAYHVMSGNAAFNTAYPGYAAALLPKAKKAWVFLTAHPTPLPANGISVGGLGIGGGDYQDTAMSNCSAGQVPGVNCPYSDSDNRAWAAAELYKATGELQYSTAFKTYWAMSPAFYEISNNFVYHNTKASFAYLITTAYPTDSSIKDTIKAEYRRVADDDYNNTYNNIYRDGYRTDVKEYIAWGQFAQSASQADNLIKAYILLGDARYRTAALVNFDAELGANPQSRSYITGIGSAPPRNPLHLTSFWLRQHGATDPIPGITVFGPHYHATDGEEYSRAAQSDDNIYPSLQSDAYPILRRYFDVSGVVEQSEFGIGSIAPILAAFAYFAN